MGNTDKQFGIAITTTGDATGVEKVRASVKGLNDEASGLKGLNSVLGSLGVAELGVGAAAAAATAFVSKFLTQSVIGAEESETATNKLNNALANTGQFSQAASEGIQELASKYQELTNISDETWTDAASKLVQFGAKVEELPALFPILEGLAGRMGGDISAAADLLGKALAGNARGLAQFGIKVEEGASKLEILRAVQEAAAKGQGNLQQQAQTLTGRVQALSKAWGDLQEAFGGKLTKGGGGDMKAILDLATNGLRLVTKNLDVIILRAKEISTVAVAPGVMQGLQLLGLASKAASEAVGEVENKATGAAAAEDDLKAKAEGASVALDKEKASADALNAEMESLIKHTDDLNKIKEGDKGRADEVTKAKLARDTAKVDAAAKDGRITPDQAILAKENLQTRAEEEMFQRAQQRKADEIKGNDELLKQLEEKRRLVQNSFSNQDDEKTAQVKLESFQKAMAVEEAQRQKNVLENSRLQAEIDNDARVQRIKDEARRITAVSDITEAQKKLNEEKEKEARADEKASAPKAAHTPAPRADDNERNEHGKGRHERQRGRIDGRAPLSSRDRLRPHVMAGETSEPRANPVAAIEAPARALAASAEKGNAAADHLGAALQQGAQVNGKMANIAQTTAGNVQALIGLFSALQAQVNQQANWIKNLRSP